MTRAFEVADQGITLSAVVVEMGSDLLVAVTGGERPHIGSASVSVPRPSLADPAKISSTTSTINLTGHKDNFAGDRVSSRLSAALNTNVVAVSGIHVDNIGPEGIEQILTLTDRLAAQIIEALSAHKYKDRQ
jgi:hypothetical protein